MNHEMRLYKDPFERIKSGVKVIEVRLFDEKRASVKIGDTITFISLPECQETVDVKVYGLSRFSSFHELFTIFGTDPFGHPPAMTVDQQVAGMRDAYTEEQELKYGVLGIHIKRL